MNSEQIIESINQGAVNITEQGHRSHLGASIIGRSCSRELWYKFYWIKKDIFEGRMLRLFARGQNEEIIFEQLLTNIGCTVHTHDANGEQFRCSYCHGHFGGSLDGVGEGIPTFGAEPVLLEMKTHNDKSFKKLLNQGLIKSKQEHFIQTQIYMYAFKLRVALYMAVNKNDDDLWVDEVLCMPEVAEHNIRRGELIIFSPQAPNKISEKASWYECKMCNFYKICHGDEQAEVNCRTCRHSRPVEGNQWVCAAASDMVIDKALMATGCQGHVYRDCLTK